MCAFLLRVLHLIDSAARDRQLSLRASPPEKVKATINMGTLEGRGRSDI
ncbi:hypothetical protein Z949_772 [Sulfitobacter guttiformis KCTC 32187]|nr:hypothetical protein Z949_772 [Sulfitobacter guttiformis KCTC 32187]